MPGRTASLEACYHALTYHAPTDSLTWKGMVYAYACSMPMPITCIANCLSRPTVAETAFSKINMAEQLSRFDVADGAVMGLS